MVSFFNYMLLFARFVKQSS